MHPNDPDPATVPTPDPAVPAAPAAPDVPQAPPPPPSPVGRRRLPSPGRPIAAILVAVAFVSGIGIGRIDTVPAGGEPGATSSPSAAAGPTSPESVDDLELIEEAWNLLHRQYVGKDTLDDRELAYAAIDGLTEAVGDTGHTSFMTPEERESRGEELSGSYVGIGVQVDETEDGSPLVVGVFRESPADSAGLRPGDVITAVDGRPTAGEDLDGVIEWIRGEAGSAVSITVRAGDSGPERTVRIVRAEVEIVPVTWTVIPGTTTGFLRLEQFSNGAADEVVAALGALREAGADRLILDLRGNPGGYVDEAIGIASQFIAEGTVYVERNAQGEEKAHDVSLKGLWRDQPLVVLVDEASASSAEIVSGALQDHERATLIGATTFGTGTVLGEYALEDGSALRIGTVEWLTPDGRRIWHEGIEPDIAVTRPTETLPTVPDDLRDVAAGRVSSVADPQLRRAIEVVEGLGS